MKDRFFITTITLFLITLSSAIKTESTMQKEKTKIEYSIRKGVIADKDQLKHLHIKVATTSGGLVRSADEMTDEYITSILTESLERGIIFVAEHNNIVIGSVFKYKEKLKALEHVLYEGTVLVDPDYQGNGIGTALYSHLLHQVKDHRPDILRVNLKVRASSPAVRLYEKLGFQKEGEYKNLVINENGQLETVVSMAWFNPNFAPIKFKNMC
jgi:putative acetyltransferase